MNKIVFYVEINIVKMLRKWSMYYFAGLNVVIFKFSYFVSIYFLQFSDINVFHWYLILLRRPYATLG